MMLSLRLPVCHMTCIKAGYADSANHANMHIKKVVNPGKGQSQAPWDLSD